MSHSLSTAEIEQLKYPIGKIVYAEQYNEATIRSLIRRIEEQPMEMLRIVAALKPDELSYCYRPGSWNIRQIIHHVPDSSLNAFIRTKLAVTEENPTVKPYDENKWAELPDYDLPVIVSAELLSATHRRWVAVLKSLSLTDFEKTFYHPEHKKNISLKHLLSMYAWHGDHHIAQIKVALEKKF